ncbi:MAG: DUF86 domain-containing protein [Gammaproteobacteria bacterium]|nr:DUF86 domain-containing protein [Gammaproteobacteria bacterium]
MQLIVEEKLEALRRCVARIEAKRAASAEELSRDPDRQDILSLNLTRAVQLCVDIAMLMLTETDQASPQTMGEAFDALAQQSMISEPLKQRLRAAVGFRNIAVHNYQAIDWTIVHAITHESVEDFRDFARTVETL